MADIAGTILNLVTSINSAANRSRVNKKACAYLSLKCNHILRRVENGDFGPSTDPKLDELVETLKMCRTDLTKFACYGWLLKLIRSEAIPDLINLHSKELDAWTSTAIEGVSPRESDKENIATERLGRTVNEGQHRPVEPQTLNRDHLQVGHEVGKFPFGTIHEGTYKDKPVSIRKLREDISGSTLALIRGSVRQSLCLVDCNNVVRLVGICKGRMIVTETTTEGPLSAYKIRNTLEKVVIARKVADVIMGLHKVEVDGGKSAGLVLRDIRASNILLDRCPNAEDDLEPKLTGFEMCRQACERTGDYPEMDPLGRYSRWWAPEANSGTNDKSDVYSFGVLMYEISTGSEPTDDGDLVELEDMGICTEYTDLMKRCLGRRHRDHRPTMEKVVEELLSIELMFLDEEREP